MTRHRIAWIGVIALISSIDRVSADDWPQWGGPNRDLVWCESGVVEKLPVEGKLLPRVWSTPIGRGYAGPAVADGRVFVMDRPNNATERILCLDAENGEILWDHAYRCRYTVSYPVGPRCTPTIDSGRVYCIGAMGNMFCLSVKTGDVIWEKNFVSDYQTRLPNWGMVAGPLILDNQCITLVGGRDALVVSFDKATGKELWRSLDDGQVGYAPPVLFRFGQTEQLIIWHPTAVSALDPQTGGVQWQVPFPIQAGLTIPTPRQHGNRLFVTAFYNGPMMLEVNRDGSDARVVWRGRSDSETQTDGLHSIMSTPLFDGTHIYGVCSYGQLRCLNAKSGERIWETLEATGDGRWWNAFLIPHEPTGHVFLHNEQGELIIADLTPQGFQEISRAQLVQPTQPVRRRMTIWSHPAFAMKSVFARNDREIVRVDLSTNSTSE